jgi:hypothetical protein
MTVLWIVLGTAAGVIPFIVGFRLCKSKSVRVLLAIPPSALLLFGFLLASNYSLIASALPYDHLGTWKCTDVDGNECQVDVYAKKLNDQIPPGLRPRLKVVASSQFGRAATTFDTDWRGWIGSVQPVPGGVRVFGSLSHRRQGVQFQLKGTSWNITAITISEAALRGDADTGTLK